MNSFSTRVELHNATYQDYETLHAEMQKRSFKRVIQDTKTGLWYHLPTAEYHYTGALSVDAVNQTAVEAAKLTGKRYNIITTQSSCIRWTNLEPVKSLVHS